MLPFLKCQYLPQIAFLFLALASTYRPEWFLFIQNPVAQLLSIAGLLYLAHIGKHSLAVMGLLTFCFVFNNHVANKYKTLNETVEGFYQCADFSETPLQM